MFRKGETYEVTMWANAPEGGGHQVSWIGQVVETDGPLVKFSDSTGAEVIVNTNSVAFVGAKVAEPI